MVPKVLAVLLGVGGLVLLWVPHFTLLGFFALATALLIFCLGAFNPQTPPSSD